MIREEQIKKQADIYTDAASNYTEWSEDNGWSDTNDVEFVEKAFIQGAKWADKTMIEKACEWLLKGGYFVNNTETINDFKQAMNK